MNSNMMNMEISTYVTIGGRKITNIVSAVEIEVQTKSISLSATKNLPDFKLFETQKRSTRKSVLKQIVKKENDLGIRH